MKKVILSVVALAAFGFAAQAQDIKFGVKAGLNYSTLTGDAVNDPSGRAGLHIGGLVELKLTDKFSIQPELLYSMQGVQDEYSYTEFGVTVKEETKTKLDYLTLPIMAKYYIVEGFSVEAGPQIGFLLNAENENEYSAGGETETETVDVKDNFKSVDFGFNVGAGYELPMGLFFNARYNMGLSKIGEEYSETVGGTTITVEAPDVRNSVFQLSVGYKF